MASKIFGTAHVYGLPDTITNASVISFSHSQSYALEDETVNENGVVIESRHDDKRVEADITLKYQSGYTAPAIGDQLTYDSVIYAIISKDSPREAQGYATITLKLRTWEGITLV